MNHPKDHSLFGLGLPGVRYELDHQDVAKTPNLRRYGWMCRERRLSEGIEPTALLASWLFWGE